jgi:hypothetical protein
MQLSCRLRGPRELVARRSLVADRVEARLRQADLTTVADTLLHWEQSLGHDLRVGRELPRSYRAVDAGPSCPSWACAGRNVMVMICRVWRGWATKDNAEAYEGIVRGEVIPASKRAAFPDSGP